MNREVEQVLIQADPDGVFRRRYNFRNASIIDREPVRGIGIGDQVEFHDDADPKRYSVKREARIVSILSDVRYMSGRRTTLVAILYRVKKSEFRLALVKPKTLVSYPSAVQKVAA